MIILSDKVDLLKFVEIEGRDLLMMMTYLQKRRIGLRKMTKVEDKEHPDRNERKSELKWEMGLKSSEY